jgi:hypothetical protein
MFATNARKATLRIACAPALLLCSMNIARAQQLSIPPTLPTIGQRGVPGITSPRVPLAIDSSTCGNQGASLFSDWRIAIHYGRCPEELHSLCSNAAERFRDPD